MIPKIYIDAWRHLHAPWSSASKVEHDLVLSRALINLYQDPLIAENLVFKGGTALNKLFVKSPRRFSEDLDFSIVQQMPIGNLMSAIRSALDPWLGMAKYDQRRGGIKLYYRYQSEGKIPLRLKIEINTSEAFTVYGYQSKHYAMQSDWYSGAAIVKTFSLEEMMGTKLKALYQRSKGRDLFDVWLAISELDVDIDHMLTAFQRYTQFSDVKITRALFEKNLFEKMHNRSFNSDMTVLLAPGTVWSLSEAYRIVMERSISKLPGDPWKKINANTLS